MFNLRHNIRVKATDSSSKIGDTLVSVDSFSIEIDNLSEFEEKCLKKISKEVGVNYYKEDCSLQINVPNNFLSQVISSCHSIKEIQHIGTEVQKATEPLRSTIIINGRSIDFSKRSLIMGILNVTSDSFYPASRTPDVFAAVDSALRMAEQGVDIIDVGGESTRPGSSAIAAEEEIRRILPVIEAIAVKSHIPISVDTTKGSVAKAALEAGASMINDVSGFSDNSLLETVVRSKIPVVVMHSRGTPKTMQKNVHFEDTIREVLLELKQRLNRAYKAGLSSKQVIIDPGIGFGKKVEDNLRVLGNLSVFRALGPVMIGVSRKSFLGEILGVPVEERLMGTVIAHTIALMRGANILRVHDISAALQVINFVSAVENICTN